MGEIGTPLLLRALVIVAEGYEGTVIGSFATASIRRLLEREELLGTELR